MNMRLKIETRTDRLKFFILQFLFVSIFSFFLGIIYGGFSISSGTTWIFPFSALNLGALWEPLGWWDSVLTQAALFFEVITAPLFAALFARMFHVRGIVGFSYVACVVGGLLTYLWFLFGLMTSSSPYPALTLLFAFLPSFGAVFGYGIVLKKNA